MIRRVIGITGWSGSGKTALIVRLIPELSRRGLRVATVKHAHHDFDIDKPGKDSYQHRAAGAVEVTVSSARRWAIVHENRDNAEPSLEEMLERMSPADIVLVEGYKSEPHPKLEVWRGATGKPPLYRNDPTVIAVATDDPAAHPDIEALDLNDTARVARFIVERCMQPAEGAA